MLPTEAAICISALYKTVSLYPVNWNFNVDFALNAGWVLCEQLRPFAIFQPALMQLQHLCVTIHTCLFLLNVMAINRFD